MVVKNRKSGFTFMELLIVVAVLLVVIGIIIGFLVSVNTRAADTRIKSNLGDLRKEASFYFNDDGPTGGQGGYKRAAADRINSTSCVVVGSSYFISSDNGTKASRLLSQATDDFARMCRNTVTMGEWLVAVDSASNPGIQYFCSDSTGNIKLVTGNITTGLPVVTPFVCP